MLKCTYKYMVQLGTFMQNNNINVNNSIIIKKIN